MKNPPQEPLGWKRLTLYCSEPRDHRRATRRTGTIAVQTPPFVQVGRGLHGDFMLEICRTWKQMRIEDFKFHSGHFRQPKAIKAEIAQG